ncbi:hypothetical protein BB422_07795 [Helicobacter pylori]|nr:hypothetical protein BB422_07795 [Helicobacter pylori]
MQQAINPTWRQGNGRPKNSGIKQSLIQEWRIKNPQGKKIDCHRESGLSRPTIDKWWDTYPKLTP